MPVKDDGNRLGCARCHNLLADKSKVAQRVETKPKASTYDAKESVEVDVPLVDPRLAPPTLDDWSLDADLAAVTRLMQSLKLEHAYVPQPPPPPAEKHSSRRDSYHDLHAPQLLAGPHFRAARSPKRSNWLTWPALMTGMMGFTCGAVLLTWSFLTGRGDLWAYGMPTILAGQALLVLGLVLQLEGLWQNNRETRDSLRDLDKELAELRHATTLLTSSQSGAGQSFYAHMAEGASPNLLLADVKGQLDLLAARLAQTRE